MTVSPTAVLVLQVPNHLPPERMTDKLTIHFLRPRNGGGEVLRVLYPIQQRNDQAFVIFEQPEVATSVLQRSHVLKLGEQGFPLVVQPADRPEVDVPGSAVLDLREFPSDAAVMGVLQRHGLVMQQPQPGQLLLRGTFLKLRAAQAELQQLLTQDVSHHKRPKRPESTSKCQNGDAVHAGYANSLYKTGGNGTQAFARDALLRSSYSREEALRPSRGVASKSQRSDEEMSFLFDADTLHYAQTFNKPHLQEILDRHGVQMTVTDGGDKEVCGVMVSGVDPVMAKVELQNFLMQLGATLRTQEIPLATFSHNQQFLIGKQVQTYRDRYPVIVRQVMDAIELIGPSKESFELKQRLMGKEISLARSERAGRAEARSDRRRSTSLPRQANRGDAKGTESQLAGANGYSPSKYQQGMARNPSPPAEPHRGRSNSESRNKVKSNRAAAQETGIPASPVGPKSTGKRGGFPNLAKPLIKDLDKKMKDTIHFKKKAGRS